MKSEWQTLHWIVMKIHNRSCLLNGEQFKNVFYRSIKLYLYATKWDGKHMFYISRDTTKHRLICLGPLLKKWAWHLWNGSISQIGISRDYSLVQSSTKSENANKKSEGNCYLEGWSWRNEERFLIAKVWRLRSWYFIQWCFPLLCMDMKIGQRRKLTGTKLLPLKCGVGWEVYRDPKLAKR